jgi:Tfp pilus assembly protein PilE
MLTSLRKNFIKAKYGSLALEIVVVILGILIAFEIDSWAQEVHEREQEQNYLVRLKEDLQFEIRLMTDSFEYAEQRIIAAQFLEDAVTNPKIATERPNAFAQAMERVTWRSFPYISAYVYTELQSTGHLSLIRSDVLRRDMADYYSFIQHESGIGLDLEIQNLFTRLTAGILSTAELVDIQENELNRRKIDITPERALEIARDFADRQDAVDLLPSIVQHHSFNKIVIEASRDKAQQLIVTIDALIEEFNS